MAAGNAVVAKHRDDQAATNPPRSPALLAQLRGTGLVRANENLAVRARRGIEPYAKAQQPNGIDLGAEELPGRIKQSQLALELVHQTGPA